MTSSLTMYPYQRDALNQAKARNTIVNLPTGKGKTLIAAKLIEHYLLEDREKNVAFLVPTRALVTQQSEYCTKHCRVFPASGLPTPPVVMQLVGQEQADWSQSDWDNCMRTCHILLGTAELFKQAFVTHKFIDVGKFSLIVLDECHNAIGNSPMASVMRDAVAPYQAKGYPGPRIIGLTASFVNGSLKKIEKKRRELEALLLSKIVCPDVDLQVRDDSFKSIRWSRMAYIEKHVEAIDTHVKKAVELVDHIKDMSKVVRHCIHVFEQLGFKPLMFYIDRVIVDQIREKAKGLQEQQEVSCISLGDRMLRAIPPLRRELDILRSRLQRDPVIQQAEELSPKVRSLIELLTKLFRENDGGYRGIVFVEQVALVSSLAKVLNDSLSALNIECGAVAGTGSQTESERQQQLDKFRTGESRLLVATASLEEGIDVPECAFVVRYTTISTTKAHIQGAGRARHPNAVVYYFENDPQQERRKERALTDAAKDMSLALTDDELKRAVTSINIPFHQRHPYPFQARRNGVFEDEGEVNVFNCKQIFNQFCSITLGATVQPKKTLYEFELRGNGQKLMSRVRYPSPTGWISLEYRDFESFWGETNFDEIFGTGRTKKKSASEKEEMCFVYMVVVHLREQGFLTSHNRPNALVSPDIRRNCPLDADWPPKISIHNRVFQSNHSGI